MFEISLSYKIRAEKEFVFDWWTDLTPEDTALVRPLKKREIISKTSQLIVLRDAEKMYFKTMKFDVRVSLERPDKWTSEYEGSTARAKSEYLLKSEADGTTMLSYHSKIEPKGFLTRIMTRFVKPFVKRVFAGEMKIFIQTLEEDYRNKQANRE